MKICQPHWDKLKAAVERKGMMDLCAKSGPEAVQRVVTDLQDDPNKPGAFDPLMSANFMIWNRALDVGGLYLMGAKPDGEHYCPLCEVNVNAPTPTEQQKQDCKCPGGFTDWATCWIEGCTDEIVKECQVRGLLN